MQLHVIKKWNMYNNKENDEIVFLSINQHFLKPEAVMHSSYNWNFNGIWILIIISSSTVKLRPLVMLGPPYISVPVCQVQTSQVRTIHIPYYGQDRSSFKCYYTSTGYFYYFLRKTITIHNFMETNRTEIYTI